MLQTKTFIFNPFQENTILIIDDNSKETIIIDPGCYNENEENGLKDFITEKGLNVIRLINTHCHIDHVLGDDFIKNLYNVEIEAHKLEEPLINGAKEHGEVFGLHIDKAPKIDKYISENDIVKLGDEEIKILHVPGHSPGSIVLYSEKSKFLIAGDVLFNGSIGRTDLPGGDYNTLINGIKSKLLVLNDDIIVFSGHGENTTIGKERTTNPFLQ